MKRARNGARRLLCLCLCLLMTTAGLAACSGKTNNPPDTAPPTDTTETAEPNVLDGVRFDRETLNVMSWIPSNVVEYVKEDSAQADNISHAVFLRNLSAMEQLNIGINWSERAGNGENMEGFITAARNSHCVLLLQLCGGLPYNGRALSRHRLTPVYGFLQALLFHQSA